jgi:hypothetical protein
MRCSEYLIFGGKMEISPISRYISTQIQMNISDKSALYSYVSHLLLWVLIGSMMAHQ